MFALSMPFHVFKLLILLMGNLDIKMHPQRQETKLSRELVSAALARGRTVYWV